MMMLGKKKEVLAQILGPSGEELKKEEGGGDSALHSCVGELIDAIQSGDVDGAVQALRSCFMELDSQPHVEGPHLGE